MALVLRQNNTINPLWGYSPFGQITVGGAPTKPHLECCPLVQGGTIGKLLPFLSFKLWFRKKNAGGIRHRTIFIAQIAGRINVFCTLSMEVQTS